MQVNQFPDIWHTKHKYFVCLIFVPLLLKEYFVVFDQEASTDKTVSNGTRVLSPEKE